MSLEDNFKHDDDRNERTIDTGDISTAFIPTTYTLSDRVLCEGDKMLVNYESKNLRDSENFSSRDRERRLSRPSESSISDPSLLCSDFFCDFEVR